MSDSSVGELLMYAEPHQYPESGGGQLVALPASGSAHRQCAPVDSLVVPLGRGTLCGAVAEVARVVSACESGIYRFLSGNFPGYLVAVAPPGLNPVPLIDKKTGAAAFSRIEFAAAPAFYFYFRYYSNTRSRILRAVAPSTSPSSPK